MSSKKDTAYVLPHLSSKAEDLLSRIMLDGMVNFTIRDLEIAYMGSKVTNPNSPFKRGVRELINHKLLAVKTYINNPNGGRSGVYTPNITLDQYLEGYAERELRSIKRYVQITTLLIQSRGYDARPTTKIEDQDPFGMYEGSIDEALGRHVMEEMADDLAESESEGVLS